MRLLLVEDDPDVRHMILWMLKPTSIKVTAVGTSEEALALVDGGGQFDAALCDYHLAGSDMNGGALIRALRDKGIEKVLLTSASPVSVNLDPLLADLPFLAKPFTAKDLRREFSGG